MLLRARAKKGLEPRSPLCFPDALFVGCASYRRQTVDTPYLLQDAKSDQLPKAGPRARRGFLVCYREEAQMEGRAGDGRSPVGLGNNGLDYHAVDDPFVAGFGPHDARRRDAIGCPLRSLFRESVRVQGTKKKHSIKLRGRGSTRRAIAGGAETADHR